MAQKHLASYQKAEDVEIVSVCDTSRKAAAAAASRTGARVADSPQEMARVDGLDAVSICTPPAFHYEGSRPFLKTGVAILCEKPLEVDARSAARLASAVKRSGAMFMTAFCHRFHPPIVALKELLRSGTLGRPLLFRNIFGGYGRQRGGHRANPALSGGGPLIDHCSHSVDLFRFLVGDPTHIQAMGGNIMQKLAIRDFGMMSLDMGGRAFGEITGSYSLPKCGNWVELYGSKGMAKVSYWNPGQPDFSYIVAADGEWVAPDIPAGPERVEGEILHFLSCVRSGKRPSVTAEDGLKANRIVAGAYASIEQGKRISLRL